MSVKSYDDYRRIALENKTDRCPVCNNRKVRRNPICSTCKNKEGVYKTKPERYADSMCNCQNASCPTRFLTFKRWKMKTYKYIGSGTKTQLVFCSDLCLKEFKENNL
jgi:hypothetical protein